MGLYARYVLPRLIETACAQKPMMDLRMRYVPHARGRVLEIGIGTGHNLKFYGESVTSVTGIDPAAELTSKARLRAQALHCPVFVIEQSGEFIPAEDAFFDTVVCTWTLCSIPNVYRALAEMRRVLTPDGKLIFIEHGRAPDPGVVRWQERIEPLWKKIGGGCHLARPISRLIEDAGFGIASLETGHVPGPKVASFMYHGVAVPR
ncbi:MAG: class I SAM-dependent methyltransferase [Gammaproteobacteria bacterium]|nr:class I SAM-dependent methyltransferase [Gammaproteobacteria bacterium]